DRAVSGKWSKCALAVTNRGPSAIKELGTSRRARTPGRSGRDLSDRPHLIGVLFPALAARVGTRLGSRASAQESTKMLRAPHRGLSKRRAGTGPSETLRRKSRTTLRYRLGIEVLEERRMLSTVTWINPNGGDWGDHNNWSTNQLPGIHDDVV